MIVGWYTTGMTALFEEGVVETGVTEEQFAKVYAFLNEIGIIDYDIEKDVVFDRYIGDDD